MHSPISKIRWVLLQPQQAKGLAKLEKGKVQQGVGDVKEVIDDADKPKPH